MVDEGVGERDDGRWETSPIVTAVGHPTAVHHTHTHTRTHARTHARTRTRADTHTHVVSGGSGSLRPLIRCFPAGSGAGEDRKQEVKLENEGWDPICPSIGQSTISPNI